MVFWPLDLPNRTVPPQVHRVCHALSLDDERKTFHPILLDESREIAARARPDGRRYIADERITQVWFAGSHANVGGGYPDDSLAYVSLCWMLNEAERCGLVFNRAPDAKPDSIKQSESLRDKYGRIYDTRRGLRSYYRYIPRKVSSLYSDSLLGHSNLSICPKIHISVFDRIKSNARPYAPINAPGKYEIVADDGKIRGLTEFSFEGQDRAEARSNEQERVWDRVWKQRVLSFATRAVVAYLLLYPVMLAAPEGAESTSAFRLVSDTDRFAGAFMPYGVSVWIDTWARTPLIVLILSCLLAVLVKWSRQMKIAIMDEMRNIWTTRGDGGLPKGPVFKIRTNKTILKIFDRATTQVIPTIVAFAGVLVGVFILVGIVNRFLFTIQDDAGLVCHEKMVMFSAPDAQGNRTVVDYKGLKNLSIGETTQVIVDGREELPIFQTSNVCQSMGVWLERGGRYLISLDSTKDFRDGDIDGSRGFWSMDVPFVTQKIIVSAAVHFKRELVRPWFRVVARIGSEGGEELFLDSDSGDNSVFEFIRATRDGELFLFVNDVVVGIPGLYNHFYLNNKGSARVTITRRP
jgi:hypothetical protein